MMKLDIEKCASTLPSGLTKTKNVIEERA